MLESEIRITSCFFPLANRIYSTSDIEKKSGYSHERVYTILMSLEKKGVVTRRNLGRVNVFRLNRLLPEAFLAYVYYMQERWREFTKKNPKVSNSLNKFMKLNEGKLTSLILNPEEKKITCVVGSEGIVNPPVLDKPPIKGYEINLLSADKFSRLGETSPSELESMLENGIVIEGLESIYRTVYKKEGVLNESGI